MGGTDRQAANQKEQDMERFLQDIEESPELKANLLGNILPDKDYLNQLTEQMDKLAIDKVKKSPIAEALDKGEVKMAGGETRKVVKGDRKTDAGKK